MRKIDTIVLHHSAGEGDAAQIKRFHTVTRGWSDIFYHFVIERNGDIFEGRPLERAPSSTRPTAIEICVIGRLHQREIFIEQVTGLEKLLAKLSNRFGYEIKTIEGHKFFDPTICPGNLDVKHFKDFYYNSIERDFFFDVSDTHWGYDAIKKVNSLGLMNGFHDGTFKPDATVTRAQVATVLVNFLKYLNKEE